MTLDATTLLNALPKPAAVFSSGTVVISANQLFSRLFHRTAHSPNQLTAAVGCDPELFASVQHAIATLSSGRLSTEFRWTGPEPDALEFIGHASRADSETYILLLDHASDQVESDEIFGVIREYLDGVLNQMPLGVIVMDNDLRVTFYNRSQASLFTTLGLELSMLEVIGSPIDQFYPVFSGVTWHMLVRAVAERGEPSVHTRIPYPVAEPTHYLQVQLLPLIARGGEVSGVICITDDVTRFVHLEEDLVRQERLAVAGQLVAKFHHEINNPLVSILGMAEMLLYRTTLDDEVARRVKRIRRGALRISEVTKKMREIRELGKQEWPELPVLPDLEIRPSA